MKDLFIDIADHLIAYFWGENCGHMNVVGDTTQDY